MNCITYYAKATRTCMNDKSVVYSTMEYSFVFQN